MNNSAQVNCLHQNSVLQRRLVQRRRINYRINPSVMTMHGFVKHHRPPHQNTVDTPLIIFLSGDGIALDFEERLAKSLSESGYESFTLKSIHFFWRAKTATELAHRIEHVLALPLARDPDRTFTIIGYSFGGAVAPFAVEAMNMRVAKRMTSLVLLAPARKAEFEFSFLSWINLASNKALDVEEKIKSLCARGFVIWTVQGEKDFPRATAPPHPPCRNIVLPGGHAFRRDFPLLTKIVTKASAPGVGKGLEKLREGIST